MASRSGLCRVGNQGAYAGPGWTRRPVGSKGLIVSVGWALILASYRREVVSDVLNGVPKKVCVCVCEFLWGGYIYSEGPKRGEM